jgi:hypothetical protein
MKFPTYVLILFIICILILFVLLFNYSTKHKELSDSRSRDENPVNHTVDLKKTSYMKRTIRDNLQRIVRNISGEIGSRGYLQADALQKTADFISSELQHYGYTISYQTYEDGGRTYKNIHTEIKGKTIAEKIIVVGAHYDTVTGTPGADDNASGIAGLLEIARLLSDDPAHITVRFVAFTLEEPPFFRSNLMGSHIYAQRLRENDEHIEGMICLESIGYFTDKPGSQFFPFSFFRWIYPDKGNFITFVSNLNSKIFLNRLKQGFQKGAVLPVESISTLSIIPGIDFSDHRSFWKAGFKAIMVTDTAFYRNPHYHTPGDVHDTLDYERMAEVVLGLKSSIETLGHEE